MAPGTGQNHRRASATRAYRHKSRRGASGIRRLRLRDPHAAQFGIVILTRIDSTVLDPTAFGTRRMRPSDYDPEGLSDEEKAVIYAYADAIGGDREHAAY